MAKFGRYDPRNKKSIRDKHQSIHKDIRIRMTKEKGRRKVWTEYTEPENELESQLESEEVVYNGYEDDGI